MIEGLYPVSALEHVCFFIRFCDYDKFQTDAERAISFDTLNGM